MGQNAVGYHKITEIKAYILYIIYEVFFINIYIILKHINIKSSVTTLIQSYPVQFTKNTSSLHYPAKPSLI